jgi:aspartate/tyrosine/aromatic aminotransferase
MEQPDKILHLFVQYTKDEFPEKVNLGIGAYRDDGGQPYVFEVVKKAEARVIAESKNKEYLAVSGLQTLNRGARMLIFGEDSPLVNNGHVASAQTIAGSGALSVGLDFLKRTKQAAIYVSKPTWANHHGMIKQAGFQVRELRYYNPEDKTLDFEHYIEDLSKATHGSIVLLQASGHNPTGVDPTEEQWKEIAKVMKLRKLFPFFDNAYQGFGTGDVEKDAFSIRHFISEGFQMVIA